MPFRPRTALVALAALPPLLAACGGGESTGGSSATSVAVASSDDSCEVENIGPGTSRNLEVDLSEGSYEVACKPGQTGDGIRTEITVTGGGGAGASEDEGYDREVELSTDGATLTGLVDDAATGERIEFKLTNDADAVRTLELKDPDGAVVSEIEVEPGTTGETVVELATAGTWQVVVEGEGVEDLVGSLPVR